jgi:hypothetical protein
MTVSIEHSVKFDDNWVMVPRTVMLKGESVSSKPEGSATLKTETPVIPDHPAPDHLGKIFDPAPETPTNTETCLKCIRKESNDNLNTTQTLECSKGKYNAKIRKQKSLLRSHQQPT